MSGTAYADGHEGIQGPIDWSGGYAGVHVGYGRASHDGISDGADIVAWQNPLSALSTTGVLGGLHVGWNIQDDNIVYGVEADVSYSGQSDSVNDGGDGTIRSDIDWMGSVRGRLGITQDRVLAFVTGGVGYVSSEFEFECNTIPFCTPPTSGSTDLNSFSWVVGGGLEVALENKWSIRFEALHHQLTNASENTSTLNLSDSDAGDFAKLDSVTVVRIGVTKRF